MRWACRASRRCVWQAPLAGGRLACSSARDSPAAKGLPTARAALSCCARCGCPAKPALRLPVRCAQALVLALLLGSLWLRSAWSTRFVALLVGALAVRCHLKPAEVERIIAIAGGCRVPMLAGHAWCEAERRPYGRPWQWRGADCACERSCVCFHSTLLGTLPMPTVKRTLRFEQQQACERFHSGAGNFYSRCPHAPHPHPHPHPPHPGEEPYTMSVRKRASRMSMAAADFAMRSVGGKAHMR